MIRLWISRDSTIPVREQLSAQLRFGILTGRLTPKEKLPSVRDLARRLKLHSNTVAATYHELARSGWVTAKSGSGVFVRDIKGARGLDGVAAFTRACVDEGLSRGFTVEALRAEFEKIAAAGGRAGESRGFVVVHADPEFARILAVEIEEAAGIPVGWGTPESTELEASIVLTTASGAAAVAHLPAEQRRLIPLKTIEQVMTGVRQPQAPFLVAIVSRSESILKWAVLLITALGGSGSDVLPRNPEKPGWKDGLQACDLVVADVLAMKQLPKRIKPIVLRLVAEEFSRELRGLVTVEKL